VIFVISVIFVAATVGSSQWQGGAMSSHMRRTGAVAVACLLATSVHATQDTRPAIDAVFAQFTAGSPGCAVGVYKDGAILYTHGYGMASLEHDAPITPGTVFYVGSISKQFTAMAAALAMQQGKLAYDDPIRKYLPELPPYADAIKVRHLIHHTSGLRDYNTLLAIAARRDEDAWNNAIVLKMTAKQKALNFEPGSEYLYSNTGYTLLATIVERATDTPFADFAAANVFTPLGMTSTHYHVDAKRLVHGRAMGYGGRDGQWTLDTPINERAGAGGLYTTVEDLLKWDENFYTGRVGGVDVLKQIQTRGTLNGGTALTYAWGLEIGAYRGLPTVEHGGALGGYRADIIRFPEQHTSVAVLCNLGSAVPSSLARRVAETMLSSRFTAPAAPAGGVVGSMPGRLPDPLTPDRLREYAGRYDSEELETTFEIAVKSATRDLTLQREREVSPLTLTARDAADTYSAGGLTLHFQRNAGGRVTGFTVDSGRVRGIVFERR
jgi:CubicO group peptidase (beta-lactamase class C family)